MVYHHMFITHMFITHMFIITCLSSHAQLPYGDNSSVWNKIDFCCYGFSNSSLRLVSYADVTILVNGCVLLEGKIF